MLLVLLIFVVFVSDPDDGEGFLCDMKGFLLTVSVTGDGHGIRGAANILVCGKIVVLDSD